MGLDIYFHRYELIPKKSLNALTPNVKPHEGVLLNIDGGYADLHPWPELGDAPLAAQLKNLSSGILTALSSRSLYFSEIDRTFRAAKKNAFESLKLLQNHILLTEVTELPDALSSNPSATFKIKIGRNIEAEVLILNSCQPTSLRLDANSTLTPEECLQFWNALSPSVQSAIEFIEDPTPFTLQSWKKLSSHGIPIARDRENCQGYSNQYTFRIIKPACDDPDKIISEESESPCALVVTSYMDHPLGQLCAAWSAAHLAKQDTHLSPISGTLSHTAYNTTDFSERLTVQNYTLKPPVGTGFGFDDLLGNISWKKLT